MSATIILAKNLTAGTIQHINDVDRGKEIYFTCVGCGKEMIAVKSVARKRDWHYRHKIESDCAGARDTALHDYAVQTLMDSKRIFIRRNFCIEYSNPRKEVSVLGKRSDVTVSYNSSELHFEVFVTHDLDSEKIALYQLNKILCVKIDLSYLINIPASPIEIRNAVLENHLNKKIIFWLPSTINPVSKTQNPILKVIVVILGVLASIFFIKYLLGRRNNHTIKER